LLAWIQSYVQRMDKEFGEVFIMAGAGDIDTLVQPVQKIIDQAS
jgi:UDP-N-acetylmuramate--alanine ligase